LIAELGTQETSYGKKPMLHIGWELPEERLSDGRPAAVSRRYPISVDPKAALRNDIESWQGRKLSAVDLDTFDIADLVGQTCLVAIQHSDEVGGRVYANVVSVMPPPRGMPKRTKTESDPVVFEISTFDRSRYMALPQFLQTAIARSPEYQAATGTAGITRREGLQPQGFQIEGGAPHLQKPAALPFRGTNDLDDDIPF
jgi:hypothetical protein